MEWDYRERVKGGSMRERKKRKDMRAREREGERGRKSGFINLRFDFFCVCAKRNKEFTKTKNEHSDIGTLTGNRGHQIAEKQQEGVRIQLRRGNRIKYLQVGYDNFSNSDVTDTSYKLML